MGGTDDKRLGGRQEKMRARWKFQEAFFFFFSRGSGNGATKEKHKEVWVTDRIKMKGYTHGLVSQQRNGAGSGGREKSLPFLLLL